MQTLSQSQYHAALQAAEDTDASSEERAEMLMEIAMGMQSRPKSSQQLVDAVGLYDRALDIAPAQATILKARITARLGTALQAIPEEGPTHLERALACFRSAIDALRDSGSPEELAELELNQGLVLQSLTAMGRARITDAIGAYQRALRTFTRDTYPQEYAVLHNNLAIAYLSMSIADEHGRMREALAVQSFEEVLKVINLIDHPSEYAMINNNLGNALQSVTSGHALDNDVRALAAYDEALKVRNPRDTPLEYANTIANKANVLRHLVVDPTRPHVDEGPRHPDPLGEALALMREAGVLYEQYGDPHKSALMRDAASAMDSEIAAESARRRDRLN